MLVDLGQHRGEDEAGGWCNVQALLSQGQPVDEILEGVLEVRGQGQCLLQLRLWQWEKREKERKKHNTEGESSDLQTEAAFVSLQQEPQRPGPGTPLLCQGEGAAVKGKAFSPNKNGP